MVIKDHPNGRLLAKTQEVPHGIPVNAMQSPSPALVSPGKLEFRIYSDLSGIADISSQWDSMLVASRCNRAFGSLEWYVASCRIHSFRKPYLMVAARGPELVCILPLALDPTNGTATFPHWENDYNDILVRGDDPVPAAGLLEYAMSGKNCSQMILSKLKPDSDCIRAAALLRGSSNIVCHARDTGRTYRYIKLPDTFDDYLASRSKTLRKGIRRILRDISADGLTIKELQPDDLNPAQLPELFISMALVRQSQKSFLNNSQTQAFVREVLPRLFIKRRLKAFALARGEQIIAIDISMAGANGFVTWNGGFLAEAAPWSPGTALFAFSIKELIAMGFSEYDFGEGDEAYKLSWTNNSYNVCELRLGQA